MAEIDDIRELLQILQTDIPDFIKTGIPENIKSQNVRSLHARDNEASRRMLSLIQTLSEGDRLLQGEDDPNVNMPSDYFAPGYAYLRWEITEYSRIPIEFYLYTGVPELGWFRFLTAGQLAQKYYATIADPNAEPIPTFEPVVFSIGDFYVKTSDGTKTGDVDAVWMFTKMSVGNQWVKLAPSSSGDGFMTLDSMNDVTSEWSALYHRPGTNPNLDSIYIRFINEDAFTISKTASFNLGSSLLFKRSVSDGKSTFNIEYWEFDNFSNTYVKAGEFLKSINGGNTFDNGDLYLSEMSIWADDEYQGFNDDYDEEEGPAPHTLNELLQFILGNSVLGNKINEGTEDFKFAVYGEEKAMWLDVNGFSFGTKSYITRMDSPHLIEMCYNENGDGQGENYNQRLALEPLQIGFSDTRDGGFATKNYRIYPVDPIENEEVHSYHRLGTDGGVIVTSVDDEVANREGKVFLPQEYIINLSTRQNPLIEGEFSPNFFQAPYPCKIVEMWAQTQKASTGKSIKISVAKNETFIGVTKMFMEIPISDRKSNTDHDIVGTDLSALDYLEFKADQIGSGDPGLGVNVFLKIKKIIS